MARKLIVVFIIAILVLALVISCAKDIIVNPPSTLVGNYHGKITIIRNYGSSAPATIEQWVQWTFSDYKFWMVAEKTDLLTQQFCNVVGNYAVTDKISLTGVDRTDLFTCDPLEYPQGTFNLIRQGDTLEISGNMGADIGLKHLVIKIVKE